jgi:dTDP-4-amino-4,6-dideoxygalactose transaminase
MIEFNKAVFNGSELTYLAESIAHGHVSGNGPFSKRAETILQAGHGGARALLTTSCTHALEMAALLAGLGPGDEVIVPSYTFVTSASAFMLHGARPVFVDVREDTLNIDLDAVRAAITSRTRVVVAVHYGGVGAQPDELAALCDEHGIMLVEDNAHGLFGSYDNQPLGTFGQLSTLSFHETKNLSCGEGGALVLPDPALVERAEILREKGTDRSKFFRGEVDKYTWVDLGSSWVLSDMLAGVLLGQLERIDEIQAHRRAAWNAYDRGLSVWAAEHGIRVPQIPARAQHTSHLYHVRMPSLDERTRFITHLRTHDVKAVFHYQSLHLSAIGEQLGGKVGQHPVTEDAADTLVRLPLHAAMTLPDAERVIDAVTSFEPRQPSA